MKKELSIEEQINEATQELNEAMIANVKAHRQILEANRIKTKTHYDVVKASQRLRSLELELMAL
jgi:excinuclease UvrABC helicase subunit UvrB